MNVAMRSDRVYVFGPFRLDPVRQILSRDSSRVNLSARLFNTLLCLVTNHDRVVSREDLEAAIWPSRTVEENNLGQAIYALRKALQAEGGAENLIVTLPGRGYQFGLPVLVETAEAPAQTSAMEDVPQAAAPVFSNAPAQSQGAKRARAILLLASTLCLAAILAGFGIEMARRPPPPASIATHEEAVAAPPHSVAVLPFTNLSGDPGQDYFSDGLSEELVASLGRISALHVAAMSSAQTLRGKPDSIADIGKLLHVRAVLEGSVRRDGARLRVTAKLNDTGTGYLLWSHTYDSDQAGIFKLQEDLAEAVTGAIQGRLLDDDVPKLRMGGTTNPQALDAFLRGMKFRNQYSEDGIQQALAAFDQALALDPNYTLAHVQHADVLIISAQGHGAATADGAVVRKMQDDALAEAQAAVAAAPGLGEAHRVLSLAYAEIWDFARENLELSRARELSPSDSRVLMSYARFEVDLGHNAEALSAAEQAVGLDPLAPELYADLAAVLALAGRPDDSLVALRHAEQLGFGGAPATDIRARAALMKGSNAEAGRLCAGGQDWYQNVCLAIADHALGRPAAAEAELAHLRDRFGDNAAYEYARIYANWGRPEDALTWLETAYRVRDDGLLDLEVDPAFTALRSDKRFRDLETRLGLNAL